MAELSRRSALPVATIKFYLREGLLPPGEVTSATRASYDETHVRRLRLVRALTDVAGMRLEAVRAVLAALDDDEVSWHDAVGSAHVRLPGGTTEASAAARGRVDALLGRHGWVLSERSPHAAVLAGALDALTELGHVPDDETLDVYADAAATLAEREVGAVASAAPVDQEAATEAVVLGTLLFEPVLLTLRRIAQENVSRRLGGSAPDARARSQSFADTPTERGRQ